LIEAIVSRLATYLIEKLGQPTLNKRFSYAFHIFIAIFTFFNAIASLWFWQSNHYQGIIGYIGQGGDVLVISLPVVALATGIVALLPFAGTALIMLFLSIGYLVASFYATQQFNPSSTDFIALTTIIGAFVVTLIAMGLAFSDLPPLSSPLARLAIPYGSRLRHLRALEKYGKQQQWNVIGPVAKENALCLEGAFDNTHGILIASLLKIQFSTSNASEGSTIQIGLTSPYDIPSFYSGPEALPKKVTAVAIQLPFTMGKKQAKAYLFPYEKHAVSPTLQAHLSAHLATREQVMPKDAIVQATPLGMRIVIKRYFGLSVKDSNPEAIIRWLYTLVSLLESVSPLLPLNERQDRLQTFWRDRFDLQNSITSPSNVVPVPTSFS